MKPALVPPVKLLGCTVALGSFVAENQKVVYTSMRRSPSKFGMPNKAARVHASLRLLL